MIMETQEQIDLDLAIFLPVLRTPAERRAELLAFADELVREERKRTRKATVSYLRPVSL